MLARVKWRGDRTTMGGYKVEHGTLLGFVNTNISPGSSCMIAMDGHDAHTKGKIVKVDYERVTVTSWFNWQGEGYEIQGDSVSPGGTPQSSTA